MPQRGAAADLSGELSQRLPTQDSTGFEPGRNSEGQPVRGQQTNGSETSVSAIATEVPCLHHKWERQR